MAWSPGVCWKCEAVEFVAVVGTVYDGTGTAAYCLTACGVCVIRLSQIHGAAMHRSLRDPKTSAELAAYYVPVMRRPEQEAELRAWVDSLMEPMPEPNIARLVYGVRGTVTTPEKIA